MALLPTLRIAEVLAGAVRRLLRQAGGGLRDACWLTRRRLLFGGGVLAAVFAAALVHTVIARTAVGLGDGAGHNLGDDFVLFWSGARLAAGGKASLAYDPPAFQAVATAATGPSVRYRIYVYPPVALLLSLPLAPLSYVGALIAWVIFGATAFLLLLHRLIGWPAALVALLSAPSSFLNLLAGQNGYFSAGLLAGGLMLLDRSPSLAGICFGCLAYKPQLAVLLPFALAAEARWRVLLAAGATAAGLGLASLAAFGSATWADFIAHAGLQAALLDYNAHYWHRMPTVFPVLRLLGAPLAVAYGGQLLSAAAALAAVVLVWRSPASRETKAASFLVATFLATPHAQDYDAVVLVFAAAWLAREGGRSDFRAWERLAALALLLLPLLRSRPGLAAGVEFAPVVLWAVMFLLVRRSRDAAAARTATACNRIGEPIGEIGAGAPVGIGSA
jgi:hypothetical protein